MGTALALAVSRCGYIIEAVVANRKSNARRAARLVHAKALALSSAELEQLPASDILFITTPDDLISETATRIASFMSNTNSRRVALHTSGALSSAELSGMRDAGFSTGSLHPLVSVSDAVAGADSLRRAFFCIEGAREAVSAARKIVRALGARSFSINTKRKALYHAAAVTASGHMVALFDIATEMLAHCGLDEREAHAILLPLVESTLNSLRRRKAALALTGTFARADASTVRRHLSAISKEKLGDALAAYTLLGARSLQLAGQSGASADALEAIAGLLLEPVDE